jgi:glycosyltransferase involved in cell wall biosynthesis
MSNNKIQCKKIVVLTTGYPSKSKGASTIVFYEYIYALCKRGYEVKHMILIDEKQKDGTLMNEYVEDISKHSSIQIQEFIIRDLGVMNRRFLAYQSISRLPEMIVNEVKAVYYDHVICFDIIAVDIAKKLGFKKLVVWLGDLAFNTVVFHAAYNVKDNWYKVPLLFRALMARHSWKLFYKNTLKGQSRIIVSSASSVQQLEGFGIPSQYLPYPWPDSGIIKKFNASDNFAKYILFGNLNALGTRSAISFMLTSVYTDFLKLYGGDRFEIHVAGIDKQPKWLEDAIQKCPNTKFIGYLEDLNETVGSYHAVLAPISVPVGNRSRIVTAMSMGALIIAHSNTALGNPELRSGKNCLLASTSEAFAKHMITAYTDKSLVAKIKIGARNTYETYFIPEIACNNFVSQIKTEAKVALGQDDIV